MSVYEPKEKIMKKMIVSTVFAVLGRGMKGCVKIDPNAQKYLQELKDGFIFKLTVLPNGPCLAMKKVGNTLVKIKKKDLPITKANLDIQFKNIDGVLPLVLGLSGVTQAYAENRFILKGEIGHSMVIVDIMNLTEAYLFPKFITGKFMDVFPSKSKSSLRAYLYLLCGI